MRGALIPPGAVTAAYAPTDTLKRVSDDVWIVDGAPIRVLGLTLPIRMTIVRLPGGDLLLHSPTQFSPGLLHDLGKLGPIRWLVAPNTAHWLFVRDWQRACPGAMTHAATGLCARRPVRRSGLVADHDLSETPPAAWGDAMALVIVPGGAGFREVAFFHRPSRTLVLTDLVLNLEPAKLPPPMRPIARLLGITAPNGRAPAYLRAVILVRRQDAAASAARLIAFEPERVIFAHGTWFERDGAARLRQSLGWLGV